MKLLRDEQGIALVTSLMLTMITLLISMVMLYMIIQNTTTSAAQKRYKNSLDAAVGGVEIVTKDALPYLLGFATEAPGTLPSNYFVTNLNSSMNLSNVVLGVTDACMLAKLTTRSWGTACTAASSSTNPVDTPDMTFTLQSQITTGFATPSGFKVYTKIVATTPGSTDMSGRNLEGQATTGSPPQDVGAPYLYRIEIASEKISNPKERANLSVLYAY